MPKIFISYRRMDSGSESDIIHNYMMRHFGKNNVFIDVESIPVGRNFRDYLSEQVASNDVVLVIIGAEWARIMKERAHQDNDFVRIEIESALAQHKLVIPVLVKGAKMPDFTDLPASINELQWLNSTKIRRKPDLDDDCAKLAEGIKEYFKSQRQYPRWLYGGGIICILLLIVFVGVLSTLGDSDKNKTKTPTDVVNQPTASITTMIETLTDSAIPSQTDEVTSTQTPTTTELSTDEPTIHNTDTAIPSDTLTPAPSDTPTFTITSILTPLEKAQIPVNQNDDWTPYGETIDNIEMVLVPVGCFMMGRDDGNSDERPPHEICFTEPFWIDKYEVTNAQYGSVGCAADSSDDEFPRNCVSWLDAQAYCQTQSGRLPTEAEWEYAARGPDNLVYPWGDEVDRTRLNCHSNSCSTDGYTNTAPVGSFPTGASWVGVMDMAGNLSEWTSTIYLSYPYSMDIEHENIDDSNSNRVIRGGSFFTIPIRSADRNDNAPTIEFSTAGFRCTRSFN